MNTTITEAEEHVATWGGGGGAEIKINGQPGSGIVDIFLEFHVVYHVASERYLPLLGEIS